MKKVLLLHIPHRNGKIYLHDYYTSYSTKAFYYWSPADLILLSGVIGNHFELTVIDGVAERLTQQQCKQKIIDLSPEVIIFTTGTATWDNDFKFLKKLKARLNCLLIGSSSVFIFESQYFLKKYPFIDALILDITSPEIVDFIEDAKKNEYSSIAFLRPGGKLNLPKFNPPSKVFSISPPRHELFPLHLNKSPLALKKPFALVVTSVGCPFSCRFCVVGSIKYRFRPVENIMEELIYLRKLGVKEVMFNDPTFTASKKRTISLCQAIRAEKLDISWVANAHVATLDEEVLINMKISGCHTLMIGVESATQKILDQYAKGISVEKVKKIFYLCHKYGLRTLAYYIIGLPGETKESIQNTIRLALELNSDYASFAIATPDIGSAMREEAIRNGYLSPDTMLFDSTTYPIFGSENLSNQDIWHLRQKAIRSFYLRPSYIFKRLTRVRSWSELKTQFEQAQTMFLSWKND